MKKRKEVQDHYRSVQTTKRGKTNVVAAGVSQAFGSITRFFTRRIPDVRGSEASFIHDSSAGGFSSAIDDRYKYPTPPQAFLRQQRFIR
eukprot:9135815-Heterocapsa_arctica.AAC.1